MAKFTKHKIAFISILWRQNRLTCVGIQVLPKLCDKFLKAHTMTPAPLSELCSNFHSTSRAGFGSFKKKSIKRDTKIENSPQVKCRSCYHCQRAAITRIRTAREVSGKNKGMGTTRPTWKTKEFNNG